MESPSIKHHVSKKLVVGIVGLLMVGAAAISCLYYYHRLNDVRPAPVATRLLVLPTAKIMPARQASTIAGTGAPSASTVNATQKSRTHIEPDPVDEFRQKMKLLALGELSSAFPDLQTVLHEQEQNGGSPQDRRVIFQLLDAEKTAPADQRPAILFVADLVASRIACDTSNTRAEANADCAHLQADFSRYGLTLNYEELGGGMFYPRDLLWRIWAEYPQTLWGERAFVLLLDLGWDTSGTCEKGGDQTREVIRQGESFLRQRPNSPYRAVVTLLVAEGYASWWSLSNEPAGSEMSDYLDPKRFQEGAEAARMKAIACFEEVLQLVPGTEMSRFAGQVLPPLRDHQILDNYRFFCVYD